MKYISKALAAVFLLAGLALGVFAVKLSFDSQNSLPRLLIGSEDAQQAVTAVMDAACHGDFARAEALFYGDVDLGINREPETPVGQLLWQAHVQSLSYRLLGTCYTTATGLAQEVEITYFDRSSVTDTLGSRASSLLQQAIDAADTPQEIYDESGSYREDVVMALVYRAAQEALEAEGKTVTVRVTVNLIYEGGRWQVLAENSLMDALSGGVMGGWTG